MSRELKGVGVGVPQAPIQRGRYNSAPNEAKPVGRLQPNRYGLYDMHGDAREWVLPNESAPYYGLASERSGGVLLWDNS